MEEILQLEREIERLQKKREDEVSQLCESSKQELQLRRDAELKRMKKEASRKATSLIDLLNFSGVDPALGEAAQAAAQVAVDGEAEPPKAAQVSLAVILDRGPLFRSHVEKNITQYECTNDVDIFRWEMAIPFPE